MIEGHQTTVQRVEASQSNVCCDKDCRPCVWMTLGGCKKHDSCSFCHKEHTMIDHKISRHYLKKMKALMAKKGMVLNNMGHLKEILQVGL